MSVVPGTRNARSLETARVLLMLSGSDWTGGLEQASEFLQRSPVPTPAAGNTS